MRLRLLIIAVFISLNVMGAKPVSLENSRVMILGDSITHGGSYISYMEYYLQKLNPKKQYDIIGIGLGSETVSGLSEKTHPFPRPCVHTRLNRALDAIKPDIVTACYGMNDGIYHPQSPERMDAYKKGIHKLIKTCKSKGVKQVILLTPPPFDPQPAKAKLRQDGAADYSYRHPHAKYASVLEDYSKWIMSLKIDGVRSIDFNKPLTAYLAEKRKTDADFCFSRDGIHPSGKGHLMMAQVLLDGIGSGTKWKDLDKEFSAVSADPMFRVIDKRRKLRSDGWRDYVGYTRGKTVKTDSVAEIEKQAAALQAQIDNLK